MSQTSPIQSPRPSALSFRKVSVRLARGKLLLDRVTLDFPGPGLYGIVGPNGAGKSSLVRTAIGLLKAASGTVAIGGRPLAEWPNDALAAHVGYVPQQTVSYWNLSVAEMLHLRVARVSPELIEQCQLGHLLERRFTTLSGGEQARVAIARALAHRPQILFADEPAAHLDMPHQHMLLRLMREFAQTRTVLVVLHDLHLASRYCDRVALLAGGRLLAFDRPAQIFRPAVLNPVYGAPIVTAKSNGWRFYTVSDAARDASDPGAERQAER